MFIGTLGITWDLWDFCVTSWGDMWDAWLASVTCDDCTAWDLGLQRTLGSLGAHETLGTCFLSRLGCLGLWNHLGQLGHFWCNTCWPNFLGRKLEHFHCSKWKDLQSPGHWALVTAWVAWDLQALQALPGPRSLAKSSSLPKP